MKAANTRQMKSIDEISINEYGIKGAVLMENAGAAVAKTALAQNVRSYAVVCGKGNNGGDGSVAARHLFNAGKDVCVVLIGKGDELSGDALVNYYILKKLGVRITEGLDKKALESCDVIIDALLGIGAKGAPRGDIKEAITAINDANKTVISVDVPSGADCDTGAVPGVCVRADITVTFGLYKVGLVCYPAAEYAGRVEVCDISFAPEAVQRQDIKVNIIEKADLPPRPLNSHKGIFGKAFALCGSVGFTGAAYLSSLAALKSGCGLVRLGIPYSLCDVMSAKLTEVITYPLADRNGILSSDCIPLIDKATDGFDSIICGCGLGLNDDIIEIVAHIIGSSRIPVVLDADGINAVSGHTNILKRKVAPIVITPHIGEMSRLTGIATGEILNNPIEVAKTFACEYNVVTVLKGATTVVALPDGEIYLSTNGNSGMATAGSGDVLAGVLGGFIAQGQSPADAAVNAVFIHARAGGSAALKLGSHGMTAGDILDHIPYAIREEVINHGGKFIQNLV
ncbi:MAG: Bifunctional NAD(P)H-hydrate repair enzyme Nnr [Firmicutes bacterium ADurb.Bin193]|nr:MAG: Bifunctional NAD(P)H-hydrate repair enzyme Nnr [Firmicutes bacterium ADurb.Bin193]